MKCPYYNEEMKTGYIQCRDGVYWSEKKRMVSALPPMNGEDVDLREICEGSYKSYAIAYDCSKCKKIKEKKKWGQELMKMKNDGTRF